MAECGHIPMETLILLNNQMQDLPARSAKRPALINDVATMYNVSSATVRRALKQKTQPRHALRRDYNQPRTITQEKMRYYCELIAALQLRTTNKKGRHLSTRECIRLLQESGVETPQGLIQVPIGQLKVSTVNRYLQRFGYTHRSLQIEPAATRFQAVYSNDCWQFDFSPSDLKKLKKPQNAPENAVLMLASIIDDRSGVCYQEYHYVPGEDAMTALRFLFNAMSKKTHSKNLLQGIPKMIYLDNGPVAKSHVFKRVMAYLGIEIKTHMPKGSDGRRTTSRSKGKVERPFRTVKEGLETLYHFHTPEDVKEINQWLSHYLVRYNDMPHRSEDHSRSEDWLKNLPSEGYREMCTWERFCTFAREPETRKVSKDARVSVNGVNWQVAAELAGQEVTLYWGLFDNELYVDYNGQHYGPFYPEKGPIPLHSYRRMKKSPADERADVVSELAKKISIPKSALTGNNDDPLLLQAIANEPIEQSSIPFQDPDPFQVLHFKNALEGKLAIASTLGFPLARLNSAQMEYVNTLLSTTLDKAEVRTSIRDYFSLRLIKCTNEE